MGLDIHPKAAIASGCVIGSRDIRIGDSTFVNINCIFEGQGPIDIGSNCAFGAGVHIVTSVHGFEPPFGRKGGLSSRPVVVEDGCWLAAEVMVLPGVTIASGCVVGARSLVTRSTEPRGLYVGSPAVRVRDLA